MQCVFCETDVSHRITRFADLFLTRTTSEESDTCEYKEISFENIYDNDNTETLDDENDIDVDFLMTRNDS